MVPNYNSEYFVQFAYLHTLLMIIKLTISKHTTKNEGEKNG